MVQLSQGDPENAADLGDTPHRLCRFGVIQPDHWLPEYTTELLNVINVLGLLVSLEPRQAALL